MRPAQRGEEEPGNQVEQVLGKRSINVDTDMQPLAAYLSDSFQLVNTGHLIAALPRGNR